MVNALAEQIALGLSAGGLYALLALGLTLIYQVSGIVNFAQGALATVGAYLVWSLQNDAGLAFGPAALISVGAAFLLGALLQALLLRPLRRAPVAASVIVTLGLLIVLEGTIGTIWGDSSRALILPLSPAPVALGPIALGRLDLTTIGATAALIAAFFAFLRWTRAGAALRAVAQSPQGARLVGIRVERVGLLAWGISAAIAATAGVFMAGGTLLIPTMADTYLLSAFVGAVIGGLESLPGAAIGALLIGVLQSLLGSYISLQWRDSVVFALLLATLLVRPVGLFGAAGQRRV
jgi:branched-chain amino acid transport system permease protein